MGHNPYFNRWFSAIYKKMVTLHKDKVTILILIDGFLQCWLAEEIVHEAEESQSLF